MAFFVPWLVDAARLATQGTGIPVYVQNGWNTRGNGGMRVVEGVVGHHTATPASSPGDYPSLNVVMYGREGLEGLLAQLGLGRSGAPYVMGSGLAYHAGASYHAGYYDLNDEYLGIEAESPGDGTWTPEQLFMYPRLVAALLYYMKRGVDRYISHRGCAQPPGRKPDPTGISDDWMRNSAQLVLNEGFDMGLTAEEHSWLKQTYEAMASVFTYSGGTSIAWVFQQQFDYFKQGGYMAQQNAKIANLETLATQQRAMIEALQAEMERLTGEVSNVEVIMQPDPVTVTFRSSSVEATAERLDRG